MKHKDHLLDQDDPDIEMQLLACGKALEENLSLAPFVVDQSTRMNRELKVGQELTHVLPPSFRSFSHSEGFRAVRNLSIGSLATVCLLAFLYWTTHSQMTFAQAVESIQKVSSYVADFSMENRASPVPHQVTMTGKVYWREPDDYRSESKLVRADSANSTEPEIVEITSRSKMGIRWNVAKRTYLELPPNSGSKSPLLILQNLGSYRKVSSKDLGRSRIDGIECTGFEVDLQEVDPDAGVGRLEVWCDDQSQLPQRIVMHMSQAFAPVDLIMQNFKWNEVLSPDLFRTEKPAGYVREVSPDGPRSDEQIAACVAESLRLYAEWNGGKYPQVKVIYGDVALAKLREFSKFASADPKKLPKDAALPNRNQRIAATALGWEEADRIMKQDAEAAYFGLTVSPSDKDKVLFRWRRADGRYHVIYGDLRQGIQPR